MKASVLCMILWSVFGTVFAASAAPVHLVEEAPATIQKLESGVIVIDFGRVTFGNLELRTGENTAQKITVHFGEASENGRIVRNPDGTIRYSKTAVALGSSTAQIVTPPVDARNTETDNRDHPPAILTPADWGTITPFRWVEIEGWQGELRAHQIIRRSAYLEAWDDGAASFESSDDMLNQIWTLSHHAIKATSFSGIYVDGDRERIPYEADAYLNQLSHYATDNDIQMARDTFDHLMVHGTWPSEWAPHMVFMAYADWRHTADADWLAPRYEALKAKTLIERRQRDGLIHSNRRQIRRTDIVDWPKSERDDFVFTRNNTVVNAFHIRALVLMAELARASGHDEDAANYVMLAETSRKAFQQAFFDTNTGLYVDGVKTSHSSIHANLFPLAFGLVPESHRSSVTSWLEAQGMKCSVYAAQYLLEGLFENGAGNTALELISAPGDRSWRHFVESGASITWEAWDIKYKPNLDWNHAWGAAPANLLPRYILGAEALSPGWHRVRIRPTLGGLSFANGTVPTPRGPILIDWENDASFSLSVQLPENVAARIELPFTGPDRIVFVNGAPVKAVTSDQYLMLEDMITGLARIEVR